MIRNIFSRHSAKGNMPQTSNMRIVLLGYRNAGKTSSVNTILGKQDLGTSGRTAECVKTEGETAGRHITVVEAPGWWSSKSVEQTPERDKREIVLSVSLCPPGPHALLLVIRMDSPFTETYRRAMQGHLELLGEKVWSHTILLFTYVGKSATTRIEQYIENGGEALHWILEKCGNRHHVMELMKKDSTHVTELLEMIEEFVVRNNGSHVQIDREILDDMKKKKKEDDKRAKDRRKNVQKQREILRLSGGIPHITHIRIALLGHSENETRSSGNTILGRKHPSVTTAECVRREGATAGRHITVVEAPVWWTNKSAQKNVEHDKREIALSLSQCPPGPHVLLLVIRADFSFSDIHKRAIQEHLELLSERVWSYTIVLFTRGDWLGDTTIEKHIESEGEALQWVVEKCGNRYHVIDNEKNDLGQLTELLEKIEWLVAGNKGCHFRNSIQLPPHLKDNTPVGKEKGSSGYPSAEINGQPVTAAASTQSSGYGTNEVAERTGTREKVKRISQIRPDGGGQAAQQDLSKSTPKKAPVTDKEFLQMKIPFVDGNAITVSQKESIGRGSYGSVYRGSYQGTPAAVKIIPFGDNKMIANEFLIPMNLFHPNIVRMMAVHKSDTQILIANEYIHGANLCEVLYKDTVIKLQDEDKLFVALDIAMAVEYIHGKDIIHQDLKPANIMIARDNKRAYLTDWGMANLKESVSMTRGPQAGANSGPFGGTPPYMAPECLVGYEKASTMSDMWSLGITLLETFTNFVPWTVSDLQELRKLLHNQQAPHALAKLRPLFITIVKPLVKYKPKSRMTAKDLVILLKTKVDLTKRYGYRF